MKYSTTEIAELLQVKCLGPEQHGIEYIQTDSRNLVQAASSLFVAIKGVRHNGHQYIAELYHQGVRSFLVSEAVNYFLYPQACFISVENTVTAFQQLCAHHRKKFQLPVIGITGSNGKTIVKEWLYQLLKDDYFICRSPKSYNSQIGVPLSVWQLSKEHTLGIFEAGISKKGEMELLKKIIEPEIGILTNIGTAHDEGFVNRNEKLLEKLKLFEGCSVIIYNRDQEEVHELLKHRNTFSWSFIHQNVSLFIASIHIEKNISSIQASYQQNEFSMQIPFTDAAAIENAIHCLACLLYLKIPLEQITYRMKFLFPVAMRMEMKQGTHNCLVINDSYNNDLASLSIALDFLNQQKQYTQKTLVLSDILQTGQNLQELYHKVAELIHSKGITTLIGIGTGIMAHAHYFKTENYFFPTTAQFLKKFYGLQARCFTNRSVLLKGARDFEFEQINSLLQQKSHDTVLEINLNHLIHNLNYYKSLLKAGTKVMAMVKASSYGSGQEIATCLQHQQVDYLAVAYADEGVELRKAGISLPIMVMSPEEQSFEDMVNYRLEPELFSFRILHSFYLFIEKLGMTSFPVHLKIDTGMRRLGFEKADIQALLTVLKTSFSRLKVCSVFSHLAASDNPLHDDFTRKQLSDFLDICETISLATPYPFLKHICNSGAISRFPNAHLDMVRLGIGMYGIGVDKQEQKMLAPVNCLKTTISQIKTVSQGESIGYNRNSRVDKTLRIATVPIGYADGFSRSLGNGNGCMYITGKKVNTIGNVCMDMCMLDISDITCTEGDEVLIFESADQLLELAECAHTIPYEILTGISTRVKRVYVQE